MYRRQQHNAAKLLIFIVSFLGLFAVDGNPKLIMKNTLEGFEDFVPEKGAKSPLLNFYKSFVIALLPGLGILNSD